jgi:hypothetical protein
MASKLDQLEVAHFHAFQGVVEAVEPGGRHSAAAEAQIKANQKVNTSLVNGDHLRRLGSLVFDASVKKVPRTQL